MKNKRLKITEKQAISLGLKPLKEIEDSGVKSAMVGDKVIRVVISGESIPKFKDRIMLHIIKISI